MTLVLRFVKDIVGMYAHVTNCFQRVLSEIWGTDGKNINCFGVVLEDLSQQLKIIKKGLGRDF